MQSRLSFVAIDFETANPDYASVCQVGLAKVVDGAIIETTSWLVVPPTGLHSFEPRFIGIHGIKPKHVRRTGISWDESLDKIHAIAGDLPFVAHNTSFDRTVYYEASDRIGRPVPSTEWFDTLVIARRYVSARNHKLPTVAEALNLPEFSHHEAEADAITSARIALKLSKRHQLLTVPDLWSRPRSSSYAKSRRFATTQRFTRVGDLPAPNQEAHPDHPLYGHHVVITGDLNGYSRDEFILKVAELGAQPQLNVTKKTTMLVVADYDVLPLEYDHTRGTGKEKKAGEYQTAGQQIQFVAATQALEYLHMTVPIQDDLEPVMEQIEEEPVLVTPSAPEPEMIPSLPTAPPLPEPTATPRPILMSSAPETTADTMQSTSDQVTGLPAAKPKRSWKIPDVVIRALAWTLIVGSALIVLLFTVGIIGATFFDDSNELTFLSGLLGAVIFIPVGASPGLLGLYFLRRRQKNEH